MKFTFLSRRFGQLLAEKVAPFGFHLVAHGNLDGNNGYRFAFDDKECGYAISDFELENSRAPLVQTAAYAAQRMTQMVMNER